MPTIKIKLAEAMEANRAIMALMGNGSTAVRPLAALRLAKAARVLRQQAADFEQARQALVREHAGEFSEVPPEAMPAFQAAAQELLLEEVALDIEPISLEAFGDGQIGLTSLIGLEWMVGE
jgi:hypothetical protein